MTRTPSGRWPASATTGARTSRWSSASRPRWRCWPARCSSAIPSAAASATWCCSGSAAWTGSSCRPGSSARRWPTRSARIRRSPASFADDCSDRRSCRAWSRDQASGRRASRVQVYGVDDRFWRFTRHGRTGPDGRGAFISRALAAEIGAAADGTVLVRIERPSAIPIESLHGAQGRSRPDSLRLTVRAVLGASAARRLLAAAAAGGCARGVRSAATASAGARTGTGCVNALLVSDRPVASGHPSPPNGSLESLLKAHVHASRTSA